MRGEMCEVTCTVLCCVWVKCVVMCVCMRGRGIVKQRCRSNGGIGPDKNFRKFLWILGIPYDSDFPEIFADIRYSGRLSWGKFPGKYSPDPPLREPGLWGHWMSAV